MAGKKKGRRAHRTNGYKRSHSFHNYGSSAVTNDSKNAAGSASQTLPVKASGFEASGEKKILPPFHKSRNA